MARHGSATGLVAALFLDCGLPPSETLDCPPTVFEALLATVEGRHRQREEKETADLAAEDRRSAQAMDAILSRLPT